MKWKNWFHKIRFFKFNFYRYFEERLMALATKLEGYRRSFEYIQDYVNIYGLREGLAPLFTLLTLFLQLKHGSIDESQYVHVTNRVTPGSE
jgi:hypothetical protein